jgi:hypothetical protein
MLVRTADARYQAVRLRARLIASMARKAFCRQSLQGFAGGSGIVYILSAQLHGSGEGRHNEIS